MTTTFPIISADSHITEPPNCYTDSIDPAFRDRAPHMVTHPERGDQFVVEGMRPISMGLVAAAGKPAEEITVHGVMFDELHRSGWDPSCRLADYCGEAPTRLLGAGQTALRSVDEGIADLTAIKAAGLRGVMMPGEPGIDQDYDDPIWDPFWQAAIDLDIPLSFHILTTRGSKTRHAVHG